MNEHIPALASPPPSECDLVERVLVAMSDALRANCTTLRGECYAHGFNGFCPQEGGWSGEVDGEFDLEELARAAIEAIPAAALIASLQAKLGVAEGENERLSTAVCSGVLGDLLTADEGAALVDFVKHLRAGGQPC